MAASRSLDYTPIASDYEQRYTAGVWSGVAATLRDLVKEESIRRAAITGSSTITSPKR